MQDFASETHTTQCNHLPVGLSACLEENISRSPGGRSPLAPPIACAAASGNDRSRQSPRIPQSHSAATKGCPPKSGASAAQFPRENGPPPPTPSVTRKRELLRT